MSDSYIKYKDNSSSGKTQTDQSPITNKLQLQNLKPEVDNSGTPDKPEQAATCSPNENDDKYYKQDNYDNDFEHVNSNKEDKKSTNTGRRTSKASIGLDFQLKSKNISKKFLNTIIIDLFNKISENKNHISVLHMRDFLKVNGFLPEDIRWKDAYKKLDEYESINVATFDQIFGNFLSDLNKCLNDGFIFEDWNQFTETIEELYNHQRSNNDGEVYKIIPQIARQSPEKFGVSFCSIEGQTFNLGDFNETFTVQACGTPINYGIVIEALGLDNFSKYVGREPSGRAANSMALTSEGKPYNPLGGCGAIMTCALIDPEEEQAIKFDKTLNWWKRLAGGYKPGYDITTYLSTVETADNDFHLAYFMKSAGLYPEKSDLRSSLNYYFQSSSIEMTCKKLAAVAATLANGGVCPISHEMVFQSSTTKHILSLSCIPAE